MIYTITLNPSLDFIAEVDHLQAGRTNRSNVDQMVAGGTAISISRLLNTLSIPTLATGFIGGETGDFIDQELKRLDIPREFVRIAGTTRINLSIFSNQVETRILGDGPNISMDELNELMYRISRVREGDYIILAGSLPPNLTGSVYDRIIEIAVVNGAAFLPIISSDDLPSMLKKRPLLITPSISDLNRMFNANIATKEEAIPYALRCIDEGARNVIVRFGRDGAILATSDHHVYEAAGPNGAIVSTSYIQVSTVAGFVGNYMRNGDPVESFRLAQAAANAAYYVKELPTREQIEAHLENVKPLPLV